MGYWLCSLLRRSCLLIGLSTLLIALMLSGCSLSRALRPASYTVHRGDTLSSIARQYGIDWHDLASWNGIGPPYRIRVGQRLSLDPYPPLNYSHMSGGSAPAGRHAASAPRSRAAAGRQRRAPAATPLKRTIEYPDGQAQSGHAYASNGYPGGSGAQAGAHAGAVGPGASRHSPQASRQNKPNETVRGGAVQQSNERRASAPAHVGGPSEDGWQWPASGSILREYNPDKGHQGLEIGGRLGAPIYAASSGKVVYNGSGLKGYGNLIIIKHDAHYLSAYGFNRNTLVKQGQNVAAGAHIADMGLGPGNKPMLHFEIRRNGAPVDPQHVLPKR